MAHDQLRPLPIAAECNASGLGLVMKRGEPAPVLTRVVYEGLAQEPV